VKQKQYIFGYGSLVSAKDIERTLSHPPASLEQTTLMGWVRDWSLILDNTTTTRRYETVPKGKVPNFVVALNIHTPVDREQATNPNGLLFPVTDEEIRKMDQRETHYYRVEVTQQITYKPDGKVYAYVGLSEHLGTPGLRSKAILPNSYRKLVEAGFSTFGKDSLEKFKRSTLASNVPEIPTIHTSNV